MRRTAEGPGVDATVDPGQSLPGLPGLRWSPGVRLTVAIAFGLTYALVATPLQGEIGQPAAALTLFPIAAAGWLLGARGGVLMALLLAAVNGVVLNANGTPGWDALIRTGNLPAIGMSIFFSIVMGGLRNLTIRMHRQGVALATEVADRRRAEAALREARDLALAASQAKSAFLANMSHEIRTPMNAILGMADVLADSPLTHEQQEYVEVFRRAGDALLSLLNDILDLSKVEAGQLELEQTDFDPAALLEEVAELLALPAHAKGIELSCEVASDVPARLQGDPQRLRQVLLNLVGNAVKFTAQGEVAMRVGRIIPTPAATAPPGGPDSRPDDDTREGDPRVWLRFSVSDTGIGIPAEKLEGIFDAFTQAEASTTRRFGGTGLGLAVVKRLVELMGGRQWAESTPGKGSAFGLEVPLEVAQVAAPMTAAARLLDDQGETTRLRGARVLVIDDSATNRLILQRLLSRHGAMVDEAVGGLAGLAALRAATSSGAPYELVLLDQRMPDIDGFEVVTRLRSGNRDTAGEPSIAHAILMLTSDQRAGDITRAQQLGLAGYLVKPVKRSALLEAAEIALTPADGHGSNPALPIPTGTSSLVSPAARGAERVLGAGTARPALPPAGQGATQRLLLVDDSADNRRLVQIYLRDLPFTLDTAEDGAAGLEAAKAVAFDLILMDMHMPVMDGLEATRALRLWEQETGRAPTAVIAMTASAMTEDLRLALDAGCDAHLAKPVKKGTLLEAIARWARPAPQPAFVGTPAQQG